MGINLVIAVTDWDWFKMLRQKPDLAEVNFWALERVAFDQVHPIKRDTQYEQAVDVLSLLQSESD